MQVAGSLGTAEGLAALDHVRARPATPRSPCMWLRAGFGHPTRARKAASCRALSGRRYLPGL